MFREIICDILFSWLPKYMKNTFLDMVSYPVEPHFYLSRETNCLIVILINTHINELPISTGVGGSGFTISV